MRLKCGFFEPSRIKSRINYTWNGDEHVWSQSPCTYILHNIITNSKRPLGIARTSQQLLYRRRPSYIIVFYIYIYATLTRNRQEVLPRLTQCVLFSPPDAAVTRWHTLVTTRTIRRVRTIVAIANLVRLF